MVRSVSIKPRTCSEHMIDCQPALTGNLGEDDLEGEVVDQTDAPLRVDQEDVFPDGGYGWVCVACVFWINSSTWGINSAFGLFLAYFIAKNTFVGATALEYAFISGLSVSQTLLVSPLTTYTTRLYSTRITLCIGILLQTGALIGASFASRIWHLFLSLGLCFGWGMGFLYVGSAGIVTQWFSTRRSLANGITAAGAGFGGIIYNLAADAMLESIGVAWALRVLALCGLVINGGGMLLIRDRNRAVQPNLSLNLRLLMKPELLLVVGWGIFSEFGYVILWFSLPNYALSIGCSSKQASIVVVLLNLGLVIGRPVIGYCSDTLGRLNVATFISLLCGLFCLLIWVFAKTFAVLCIFCLLVGAVCGLFWSTVVPVTAEVVGLKNLASALSLIFMIMILPATVGNSIYTRLRQYDASYLDAKLFTGFMFIGAAICCWGARSWRIVRLDRQALEKGELERHNFQVPLGGSCLPRPTTIDWVRLAGKSIIDPRRL